MSTADPFVSYLSDLPTVEGRVHLVPTLYRGQLAFASASLDFVKFVRGQEEGSLTIPDDVGDRPVADLRGDLWFLPALLVYATSEVARDAGFAVTLNLVASYIYDRLKKALPGSTPEARIRLFHKKGDEVFEFEFSGPAEHLTQMKVPDIVSHLRLVEAASGGEPPLLPAPSDAPERKKDEKKKKNRAKGKKDGKKSKGKK